LAYYEIEFEEPKCKTCQQGEIVRKWMVMLRASEMYSYYEISKRINNMFKTDLTPQNCFDHMKKHENLSKVDSHQAHLWLVGMHELQSGEELEGFDSWREEINNMKTRIIAERQRNFP